jgi:hypothetical protein
VNRQAVNNPIAAAVITPSRQAKSRACVVLVPFSTHIVPACERGLIALQRRGYEVWRVGGYAAIDAGRSELATKALADGFEETFWIDSDIDFSPDAVDRIRSHGLPITTGIVARKGARAIATQTLPGTKQLHVGKGGGVCEVLYAGAGFLHIRCEVYTTIREMLKLPMCNAQFGRPMVPFFQPMIVPYGPHPNPLPTGEGTSGPHPNPLPEGEGNHWYLGEDYAFCERARQCGYKIMADTSIRLWHIGEYAYGWEDAGLDRPRHDSFLFMIDDGKKQ